MRILITGGAGFIGSAFAELVLRNNPDDSILIIDKFTYAARPQNLSELKSLAQVEIIEGDITDCSLIYEAVDNCDTVINFAAETHVDRSHFAPETFWQTNVVGVQNVLGAILQYKKRLVQISTDEVYGPQSPGSIAVESSHLCPTSPYALSKALGDYLCTSAFLRHGADVLITRGCNALGPRQHVEKFVPLFITNALQELPLPLYGTGLESREWLHVSDYVAAIYSVMCHGRSGGVYNLTSGDSRANRSVAHAIIHLLGKSPTLVTTVRDRPCHDAHYRTNGDLLRAEVGWEPLMSFDRALEMTVEWYCSNVAWWMDVRQSGDFREYYARQYGNRLPSIGVEPSHDSERMQFLT